MNAAEQIVEALLEGETIESALAAIGAQVAGYEVKEGHVELRVFMPLDFVASGSERSIQSVLQPFALHKVYVLPQEHGYFNVVFTPRVVESVAVDLDGTLAKDSGWKGAEHIGEPVKPMLDLVNKLLDDGEEVVIFTARVHDGEKSTKEHIAQWLKDHDLPDLEITNEKRPDMEKFYDDKAVAVEKNKGVTESKPDLIATMKRIVDVWAYEDWDWVSDGCADVSYALWRIGQKLGWPISVVTGNGEMPDGDVFPHAWVTVGGRIFDPVAYANGYKVKNYHPFAGDHVQTLADTFGVETDDNYDYGFDVDSEIKSLGL